MKNKSLLVILLLFSQWSFSQTYTTGVVNLSSTAGLSMSVKLDITTNVTMTLTGPSGRWFALGFDASSMTAGTDVVGVHAVGLLPNFDAYLTGSAAPATDPQQDWTITSDQVASGVRTIIATRALNTGDANDYVFTAGTGTLSLIWARGNTSSFNYAYHGSGNRGIINATFSQVVAPPAPTGAAMQTLCTNSNLSQLSVNGTNVQWYSTASGGNPLPPNTILSNGTTYYASQTVNGVQSLNRLAVLVTLIAAPTAAPVFNNPVLSVCSPSNNITYSVNAVQNASSYSWVLSQGLSGTSQLTSISVSLTPNLSNGSISVSAVNQCGQGPTTIISITQHPSYFNNLVTTACDSFLWIGQWYVTSGTFTSNSQSQFGCDSISQLQLTVLNNSQSNINIGQCSPLLLNGQTYTQSGSYQQTLNSSLGCDSIVNIQFTLFSSDTVTIALEACDSIEIGGQLFTSSGLVPQLLSSTLGCDSLVLWQLTINPTLNVSIDTTVTDESYEWNGSSYAVSGIYSQIFTSAVGCDSIVTVNLTVLTSGVEELGFIIPYPTILQVGEWLHIHGQQWDMFDVYGNLVYTIPQLITKVRMDFPAGFYILKNREKTLRIMLIN